MSTTNASREASESPHPPAPAGRPVVVGVGASAGGLEALRLFFGAVPATSGLVFVVVSHTDPSAKTLLPEILTRSAHLPVSEASDGDRLTPNHVYIAPGHSLLTVEGGVIRLTPTPRREDRRAPIDRFFHSLARSHGSRAVAVILSGSGSDGALGLKSVNEAGGLTLVQDPVTAGHEGMPQSAIDSGVADHALPPEEMAKELLTHVRHLDAADGAEEETRRRSIEELLPQICDTLLQANGQDFKHYKTTTLVRRIARRIQILRLPSAAAYLARLSSDPAEATQLFNELLINVTAFFRDPPAFESLAREVLPKFFKNLQEGEGVRVWVPGCSTGEEAYTLAILLLEQMDGLAEPPEVQVFATDIDEEALAVARAGSYPLTVANHISAARLDRYFTKKGQHYQVTKPVRDLVVFSLHNLVNDPPFSRLDLISCRNLLIYLGGYLQKKLIPLFHYALRPGGHLLLGPSENLNGFHELFRTVDAKNRISRRLPTGTRSSGLLASRGPITPRSPNAPPATDADTYFLMERVTLDDFAPKTVVVDEDGRVICSSGNLDKYLALTAGAFHNSVTRLAREGLRMGLRAALADAVKTQQKVARDGLSLRTEAGLQRVLITVQPMVLRGGEPGHFHVAFQDIGLPLAEGSLSPVPASDDAAALIEQLERELIGTREDLERTVQDLESANEELKSGNEELLSMNEELQSGNEELETAKDEAVGANDALARANADLENLLASTLIPTVFLDAGGTLRQATPSARAVYHVRPGDIGRPLAELKDKAIAMPPLPPFDAVGRLERPFEDEVEMTDGTWYLRRVLPYRTNDELPGGVVITFIDLTERRRAEEALRESEAKFRQLAETIPNLAWMARPDGHIFWYNRRWYEYTGTTPAEMEGWGWQKVHDPDVLPGVLERWKASIESGDPFEMVFPLRGSDGQFRPFLTRVSPFRGPAGDILFWFGTNTDISDQKRAEEDLARAAEREQRRSTLLARVAEASRSINVVHSIDSITRVIAEEARRVIGSHVAVTSLTETNGCDQAVRGVSLSEKYSRYRDREIKPDGLSAHVCQTNRPLRVAAEDVESHPEWKGSLDRELDPLPTRGWLGVPLVGQGGTNLGLVQLTDKYEGDFTEEDEAILTQLAAIAAVGIQNARLYDSLREQDQRKDEFLATLAHELRNPLAPVRSGLAILKVSGNGEQSIAARDMMERQLGHMVRLVDDLMDVSRVNSGKVDLKRERVAVREVIDVALETSRPLVEAGRHELAIALPDEPLDVDADLTRLAQVVSNLLNNSAKYTPEGGRIELCAGRQGEHVVIRVTDTGMGIPPEMLPKVFDLFTQVGRTIDRAQGGLGIGLSFAKRLVELHGGTIWAESPGLGEGSTFSVRLPLSDGRVDVQRTRAKEELAAQAPSSGRRILVVDDNRDGADSLAMLLGLLGHDVRTAHTGEAAIEAVRDFPPDTVFLDIGLPGMNGYQVAAHLRDDPACGNPVLIALTGWGSEQDRERSREAGFDFHLTKPVELDAVQGVLERFSPLGR